MTEQPDTTPLSNPIFSGLQQEPKSFDPALVKDIFYDSGQKHYHYKAKDGRFSVSFVRSVFWYLKPRIPWVWYKELVVMSFLSCLAICKETTTSYLIQSQRDFMSSSKKRTSEKSRKTKYKAITFNRR